MPYVARALNYEGYDTENPQGRSLHLTTVPLRIREPPWILHVRLLTY